MEPACCPVPSRQRASESAHRADPHVTVRVFEQAENIIRWQAVFCRIDCRGSGRPELFHAGEPRVANKALSSRHPPLSLVILKHHLIPAPTPIFLTCRQLELDGQKPVSIKSIY